MGASGSNQYSNQYNTPENNQYKSYYPPRNKFQSKKSPQLFCDFARNQVTLRKNVISYKDFHKTSNH